MKLDDEVKQYANAEWERCARVDRMVGRVCAVLFIVLAVAVLAGY